MAQRAQQWEQEGAGLTSPSGRRSICVGALPTSFSSPFIQSGIQVHKMVLPAFGVDLLSSEENSVGRTSEAHSEECFLGDSKTSQVDNED